MTKQNVIDSKWYEHLAEWTRTWRSHNSEGMDAPQLYVFEHVEGWRDAKCHMDRAGCANIPTCQEIAERYPNEPSTVRTIYFTIQLLDTLFYWLHLLRVV